VPLILEHKYQVFKAEIGNGSQAAGIWLKLTITLAIEPCWMNTIIFQIPALVIMRLFQMNMQLGNEAYRPEFQLNDAEYLYDFLGASGIAQQRLWKTDRI